jgi:uncharacterized protein (TIGR02391 family)
MNLETRLDPRLWEAVRASAEARQFSNVILDAIHFLSDVIRDRAGLEGDGVALVGQAFGGPNPKLKVNKLQTESEQNVQRGIEALLRGIYMASGIRAATVRARTTRGQPRPSCSS